MDQLGAPSGGRGDRDAVVRTRNDDTATPDGNRAIKLAEAGSYVVVPRGVWHTAEPSEATRLLFITPGEGTEHRAVA